MTDFKSVMGLIGNSDVDDEDEIHCKEEPVNSELSY